MSLPQKRSQAKLCKEMRSNKISHKCTQTKRCQIYIKITRCATRCNEGPRGGLTLTALSNSPPSLLSPPLLSSRDMCIRCASRQFQLSVSDAQTVAVSPFPSWLPLTILLLFLYCLYSSSLYFPLLFLYSVILPGTFPPSDIKAGPVGGRALVSFLAALEHPELLLQLERQRTRGPINSSRTSSE